MFSADLIPCTLTLPLISLAQFAPARASVMLAATAAFAAIPDRLMTFLSLSDVPEFRSLGFGQHLENVVDSADDAVRVEEYGCAVTEGNRLLPPMLVFECNLDVRSHQELDDRAEAVARGVAGPAVGKIRWRIDKVIAHQRHSPGIDPILSLDETTREGHWRGTNEAGSGHGIGQEILIVSIHTNAVEFEVAILESEVATGAIERLVNRAKS